MIFFLCFGFVVVVPGNPETQTVSDSFPKVCAALQKKVTGATALCVSQCDASAPTERGGYRVGPISVRARRNKSRHAVRRDG